MKTRFPFYYKRFHTKLKQILKFLFYFAKQYVMIQMDYFLTTTLFCDDIDILLLSGGIILDDNF